MMNQTHNYCIYPIYSSSSAAILMARWSQHDLILIEAVCHPRRLRNDGLPNLLNFTPVPARTSELLNIDLVDGTSVSLKELKEAIQSNETIHSGM